MIIGRRGGNYPIYWIVGDPWEQLKTGEEILNYAVTQGCNVVFLLDAGTYMHTGHRQAFMFNAKLLDGNLYLCEDLTSGTSKIAGVCVNGGTGAISGKKNRVLRGYSPGPYDFYDDSYMPNSFKTGVSGYGRSYDGILHTSSQSLPTIVLTTLEYNRVYVNDEDVTPINPNWKSVKTVSGKWKTYTLTKYLNINNGDPVNNVSYVNNVDVSAKSKVNNMVDEVVVENDKVTVKYEIPAGSYSYIKLVYKKDSIPGSYTDGTATDITQSSISKVFSKLEFDETGVYWFMIFTDKTSSEPVSLDLR